MPLFVRSVQGVAYGVHLTPKPKPAIQLYDPVTGHATPNQWYVRTLVEAGHGPLALWGMRDAISAQTVSGVIAWIREQLAAGDRAPVLAQDIADEALDAACKAVQDALDVPDGDFAAHWWSTDREAVVTTMLCAYVEAELERLGSRPRSVGAVDNPVYPEQSGDPCPNCGAPVWYDDAAKTWWHTEPERVCFLWKGRAMPAELEPEPDPEIISSTP